MENKNNKTNYLLIAIALLIVIFLGTGIYFFHNRPSNIITNNTPTDNRFVANYRLKGNDVEDFDFHFLRAEYKDQNIIYSPLSIKYALGMLNEGTGGNSKTQISSVIGDYVGHKYNNSSNLSLANAFFIRNELKGGINNSYISTLKNKYNAEVVYDSFISADILNNWVKNKTLGLINNIIDDDKISTLDYVLVNALGIDMEWQRVIQASGDYDNYYVDYSHEKYSEFINPLDSNHPNEELKFNNKNVASLEIGASINKYDIISTLGEENIRKTITNEYNAWLAKNECDCFESGMNKYCDSTETYVNEFIKALKSNYGRVDSSTDFYFNDTDDVKVFAKDLKTYNGTTLQYIGIMPKTESLTEFINNIDASKVKSIISNLKTIDINNFEEGYITKITGKIPVFKYNYQLELKKDLIMLGITDIFKQGVADLSGISSNGEYIDEVNHKATIEFSNEGIKAAAVTDIGGLGDGGCYFIHDYDVPVKVIDLTFDKPYIYIIRDKQSGEIWFVGSVVEPSPYE